MYDTRVFIHINPRARLRTRILLYRETTAPAAYTGSHTRTARGFHDTTDIRRASERLAIPITRSQIHDYEARRADAHFADAPEYPRGHRWRTHSRKTRAIPNRTRQ